MTRMRSRTNCDASDGYLKINNRNNRDIIEYLLRKYVFEYEAVVLNSFVCFVLFNASCIIQLIIR